MECAVGPYIWLLGASFPAGEYNVNNKLDPRRPLDAIETKMDSFLWLDHHDGSDGSSVNSGNGVYATHQTTTFINCGVTIRLQKGTVGKQI